MKITAAIGCAALLVMACGNARAAKWVSLGKSVDQKQEIFVDSSSIRIDGNIRRAWFKTQYAKHSRRDDSGKELSHTLARWAFRCQEKVTPDESLTLYYADGSNEGGPSPTQDWNPVVPDTFLSISLTLICDVDS